MVFRHFLSEFSVFPHWNEWSLRGREYGSSTHVSPLCLQTALCCICHHPSAESGPTLRWRLSRHWGSLGTVQQLFLVLLLPERWYDYTFHPLNMEFGHVTCFVQWNVNESVESHFWVNTFSAGARFTSLSSPIAVIDLHPSLHYLSTNHCPPHFHTCQIKKESSVGNDDLIVLSIDGHMSRLLK